MKYTENCIPEEELPPSAGLIVIRKTDPNFGLSDEEIQNRFEFVGCYLLKEFEVLMFVPKKNQTDDFFIKDYLTEDYNYSAYNTWDFQNMVRPFNKYGYAMKMIMEHVKDLAIMHSCIENTDNRKRVFKKFKNFVAREFGEQLEAYALQLHFEPSYENRLYLKKKIAQFEQKIQECIEIWEQYAPPDYWDR